MKKSEVVKSDKKNKKTKDPQKKKKIISIGVFVIGMIALIVGVVFLIINLTRGKSVADGEYLVTAENWVLTTCDSDNCENVIWDFTEIGKGTLTTDGGEHKYDFKWAIKDGKLIIQTEWLYEMDNEYDYSLNQNDGVLTLKDDDGEYKFTTQ